jgi:hypothetical protein
MIKIAPWARERVNVARQFRIADSTIQQAAERCAGVTPARVNLGSQPPDDDRFGPASCTSNQMDEVAVLLWILAEERARDRRRIGDLRLLLDVERSGTILAEYIEPARQKVGR